MKKTDLLPKMEEMEDKLKDAYIQQKQENKSSDFLNGYEDGFRDCYLWIYQILSELN